MGKREKRKGKRTRKLFEKTNDGRRKEWKRSKEDINSSETDTNEVISTIMKDKSRRWEGLSKWRKGKEKGKLGKHGRQKLGETERMNRRE